MTEAMLHPVKVENILSGFHLIEADAGTGKTWTLASLVVRAIREGRYQLDEILVVTFTKAATAELAERIALFLRNALSEAQGELSATKGHKKDEESFSTAQSRSEECKRLRLALAKIDSLRVQTIHGFCQSVLSENSFDLDLPANLVLKEGNDQDLNTVIAQWWREKVLARGLGLSDNLWQALFAAGLSLKVIRAVLKHALSDPDLLILPEAAQFDLSFDSGDPATDEQVLIKFFEQNWQAQNEAFLVWQTALQKNGADLLAWLCGPARKLARPGVKMGSSYQEKRGLKWIHDLQSVPNVSSLFKEKLQSILARFSRSAIDQFVDAGLCPYPEMLKACDQLLALLPNLASVNALFAQLLNAGMMDRLHEQRRASAEIGFDGLLQSVYRLVARNPKSATLLRERFPLAMIDESQDTDPLQWAIFEKIYLSVDPGEARSGLIMVGDPKQSIYSFRGADVYTYLRAGERVIQKHHLSVNRRSSPVVLEAINSIFSEKRLAKPVFNQGDIHFYPALDDPEQDWSSRPTCFELLSFDAEGLAMPDRKLQAARACATQILALKAIDANTDIAILVYSHSEAAMVEAVLEQNGIACARISKDNVWQGRWAHELRIILEAFESRGNASSLNKALLTETFAREAGVESLQIKVLDALQVWQQLGPQAALAGLILHPQLSLQAYTGYQQLLELLGDSFSPTTPAAEIVRWLDTKTHETSKQDSATPWRLIDPSAVKLMTIHHSKGLEFDCVLVPFGWIREKGGRVSLESERHHRFLQGAWRSVVDTLKSEESLRSIEDEKLSENLRLFYVAVTRAKRQLYLVSPASPDPGSPLEYLRSDTFPLRISRLGQSPKEPTVVGFQNQAAQAQVSWPLLPPLTDRAADWYWHSYSALTRRADEGREMPEIGSQRQSFQQTADYEQNAQSDIELVDDLPIAPSDDDSLSGDSWVDSEFSGSAAIASQSLRFLFPKGAKAGVVLHRLFETHPFVRSATTEQLRSYLQGTGMPEVLERLDELNVWLDEVLTTPLAVLGGQGLKTLQAQHRKMELGFTLEVSQFSWVQALAAIERYFPISENSKALIRPDLFRRNSGAGLNRLNGYLNGFIDMVFEHHGKFYILDWKSNFLGAKLSDYRNSAMEAAIAEHDYAVQWCLYCVALARWLRLKLPGRDPLPSIGGVVYAFIRGMKTEYGVYSTEVPPALLRELDALMGGTSLSEPLFGHFSDDLS
jgi:exodeoxyribonuclease V beta subunit